VLKSEKRAEIITIDVDQHKLREKGERKRNSFETRPYNKMEWNGIYNDWPLILVSDADDGKETKTTSSITVYRTKTQP
jgi:hypothetical protein